MDVDIYYFYSTFHGGKEHNCWTIRLTMKVHRCCVTDCNMVLWAGMTREWIFHSLIFMSSNLHSVFPFLIFSLKYVQAHSFDNIFPFFFPSPLTKLSLNHFFELQVFDLLFFSLFLSLSIFHFHHLMHIFSQKIL